MKECELSKSLPLRQHSLLFVIHSHLDLAASNDVKESADLALNDYVLLRRVAAVLKLLNEHLSVCADETRQNAVRLQNLRQFRDFKVSLRSVNDAPSVFC